MVERESYDNSKHQRLIDGLVANGATAKRFAQRVMDAVVGKCTETMCDDEECQQSGEPHPHCTCDRCFFREEAGPARLIPDAHHIDVENKTVTAYEVEVTHPVDTDKLGLYEDWWLMLDEFYWTLRLVIVNRFGNLNEVVIAPKGWEFLDGAIPIALHSLAEITPPPQGKSE